MGDINVGVLSRSDVMVDDRISVIAFHWFYGEISLSAYEDAAGDPYSPPEASQDRAWAHGVGTLYERDSTRRCFTVTGERPVRALQGASHAALRVRHAQHVSSFILRRIVE